MATRRKTAPAVKTTLPPKVAAWLRDLRSAKAPARNKAFVALTTALGDDALLLSVARPLVEELVQLVESVDVADRWRLVLLLADLSQLAPHGEFVTACVYPPAPVEPARAELASTLHGAVRAKFATYLGWLEDDDATVRTTAPVLLATLPEHASAAADVLRDRLAEEDDPWSAGSARFALGIVDGFASSCADQKAFESTFSQDPRPHPIIMFGTASALALTSDAPPSDALLNELLSAVEGADEAITRFGWSEGDLRGLAIRLLGAAAGKSRDGRSLDRLLELSRKVGLVPVTLINLLVGIFPGARPRPAAGIRLASQLTDGQRFVLEHLVKADVFDWDPFQSVDWDPVERMLQRAGLPVFGADLRRWLGLTPARALEEVVDGEPVWRRLRAAIDGKTPTAEVAAVLGRALSSKQIVEACADAGDGAYELSRRWPSGHLSPEQEREDLQRMARALGTVAASAKKEDVIRWAEELVARPKAKRKALADAVAGAALAALGVEDRRFAGLR